MAYKLIRIPPNGDLDYPAALVEDEAYKHELDRWLRDNADPLTGRYYGSKGEELFLRDYARGAWLKMADVYWAIVIERAPEVNEFGVVTP